MSDKIKINLQIADTNYPLTIEREEEEMIRDAAKLVNMKLNAYRTRHPNLDAAKILGMVAYDFSLDNLRQKERNDTEPYTEKIKELTKVLEDYFKGE